MPFPLNGTMDPNDPQNQPQAQFQMPGYAGYAANPANLFKVAPAVMTTPNQPTPFAAPPQQKPPSLFSSTPNPVAGPGGVGLPGGPHLSDVLKGPVQNYQDWAAANPSQLAQPIQANHPKLTMLTAALEGLSGAILQHNPTAGIDFVNSIRQHDEAVPQINQQRYQQQVVQPYQQALTAQDTLSQIGERESQTQLNQGKTAMLPDELQIKRQAAAGQLAAHGMKLDTDEQGNVTIVPDEDSPVYQRQKSMSDYLQARQELAGAQADLARSKNDPNSPAYKQAQARIDVARQNAGIAAGRLGLSEQEFGFNQEKFYNPQPTETERNASGRAQTMDDLQARIEAGLKDPEITKYMGPAGGRLAEAQGKLGTLPAKVAQFKNDLVSYGAFQAGLHPVRGIGALEYFDRVMGGLGQTPEQLAGKLASNKLTSQSVQKVGATHSGALGGGKKVLKFNTETGRLE